MEQSSSKKRRGRIGRENDRAGEAAELEEDATDMESRMKEIDGVERRRRNFSSTKNDAERERVCVSVQLCYGLTHREVTQCGCRVQGQKQNNEAVTAGDDGDLEI